MKLTLAALPLVLLALLAAIWSGLLRTGWALPLPLAAANHGNFMVNGFLASLIILERSVLFRGWWVRVLPALSAASVPAFLFGAPLLAEGLLLASATGFLLLCAWFVYRHRELHYYVFAAGAGFALCGHLVFLRTNSYAAASGWWMAFLLLTIVAERLELTKFLPHPRGRQAILLTALALVLPALLLPVGGHYLLSLSLGVTALWLLRYDMARHALRAGGSHRYSGWLLLTGYGWLLVASGLLLVQARLPLGYDAVLHSFFIGFVFSMIFAHAPVILPALLKRRLHVYHPLLYVPFGFLQLSLLLRICADVEGAPALRRWAGLGNGTAIVLFLAFVGLRTASQLRSGKA
ncbi:MAG: hypothetical protein EOO16_19630 [Chitinophagaceae bacterium]|nr:MAG: hypothetical protein EOO16_19630 [Chitinophagaceae bacterium]